MAKARQRGVGYGGLDSTRPTQKQEGDIANLGGTAPGGTVAFMGAASQWATSNAANRSNFPTPADPIVRAAGSMHDGAADGPPDAYGRGNVPIHPGFAPRLVRTGRDANYASPDGMAPSNSGVANDGHPSSPGGKHRGESPEILKQPRGAYRP